MNIDNIPQEIQEFLKNNINGINFKSLIPFLYLNLTVDALIDPKENKINNSMNHILFLLLKSYYEKHLFENRLNTIYKENENMVHISENQSAEINELRERLKTIQENSNHYKLLADELNIQHKRQIFDHKQYYESNMQHVNASYQKAEIDKNEMVLKYAKSEKDALIWKEKYEKLQDLYNRETKLRDQLNAKLKVTMLELNKTSSTLENKNKDITKLQKDLKSQTENCQSNVISLKYTQNKYNKEIQDHIETKQQLENTIATFSKLQEEIHHLRKMKQDNCTDILDNSMSFDHNAKPSQLVKSNSVNHINHQDHDLKGESDKNGENSTLNYDIVLNVELDVLREKHKTTLNELSNSKFKCSMLEQDKAEADKKLRELENVIEEISSQQNQTKLQLDNCLKSCQDLQNLRPEVEELRLKCQNFELSKNEALAELANSQDRERKLLNLNQSVSLENAKHLAEICQLIEKASNVSSTFEILSKKYTDLQVLHEQKVKEHEIFDMEMNKRITEQNNVMNRKDKLILEFENTIQNLQSEAKALKKKLTACQKDLSHHIRLLNNIDVNSQGSASVYANIWMSADSHQVDRDSLNGTNARSVAKLEDVISLKSFDSSSISGQMSNTIHSTAMNHESMYPTKPSNEVSRKNQNFTIDSCPDSFEPIDETNMRLLVDKSLRLQKALVKKKDKMEFLNDHIVRLQEELHKKGRIIQTLLINDHSGALSKEDVDQHKLILTANSAKGSIIANLAHNSHSSHNSQTLTAEINAKLQTLLEDSILKIIVLKEGMENLGHEISRLNQENKELKLSLGFQES